jgi:hypothetical protein
MAQEARSFSPALAVRAPACLWPVRPAEARRDRDREDFRPEIPA